MSSGFNEKTNEPVLHEKTSAPSINEKMNLKVASLDDKAGDDVVWDDAAEKRLVRKIDWKVSFATRGRGMWEGKRMDG